MGLWTSVQVLVERFWVLIDQESVATKHAKCKQAAQSCQDFNDFGALHLLTHATQAGKEHQMLTNGEDIIERIVLGQSSVTAGFNCISDIF